MSDRIAVMNQGQALEIDTPSALYEHPKSHFVADFLGSMNFFHGNVVEVEADRLLVDTQEVGPVRIRRRTADVACGNAVVVAIRPENVLVSVERTGEGPNSVKGQIKTTAFLGDRSHIYFSVNDGRDDILALMQNMGGAASRIGSACGDVWLSWNDDACVLLPVGGK